MVHLSNIKPLTDFLRNSKAHIGALKASGQAEVLTINGEAAVVVQVWGNALIKGSIYELCSGAGEGDYAIGKRSRMKKENVGFVRKGGSSEANSLRSCASELASVQLSHAVFDVGGAVQ